MASLRTLTLLSSLTQHSHQDDVVTKYPGIFVIAGDRGSNITGSEWFGLVFFLVITQLNFMGNEFFSPEWPLRSPNMTFCIYIV